MGDTPAGDASSVSKFQVWIPRLTLAGCALILFLRKPWALLHPQFHAEDGTLCFAAARMRGLASLLESSAGYYQLLPRLIAWIVIPLNPRYAPFVYNLAGMAIALSVVARIFSRRIQLSFKPLLAVAVVAAPCLDSEVVSNLVNSQWFTALHLILLAIADDPATSTEAACDACILLFAGLTGPFIVLFLPLFAYRFLLRRTRASLLLGAGALTLSAVEIAFLAIHPMNRPSELNALPYTLTGGDWPGYFGNGIGGLLLLGTHSRDYLNYGLLLAFFTAGIYGLILFDALKRKHHESIMFIIASAALMASTAFSFKGYVTGLAQGAGCRYFFPVIVLLYWTLASTLSPWRGLSRIGALLLIWGALASGLTLYTPPVVDRHWSAASQLLDGPGTVMVPLPWNDHYVTVENPESSRSKAIETPLLAPGQKLEKQWVDGDSPRLIRVSLPTQVHPTGLRIKYVLESGGDTRLPALIGWSSTIAKTQDAAAAELLSDGHSHFLTIMVDADVNTFGFEFGGKPRLFVLEEAVMLNARD
jgi:hypothetical protein